MHLVIHNDKQPLVLETVSLHGHEIIDRVLEALNGDHVVQLPARRVPVEEAIGGVQAFCYILLLIYFTHI